jgi:8-oxo-dGTP pyrophosphatase MutT (NUDIX family)
VGGLAGQVLKPIPSSSVILLRDPLEVLMILRHEQSSFVPNAWVFPGGAVDPDDGPAGDLETFRNAARREVKEETNIDLTGELVWTSRWITPEGLPKRFDTWFFLSEVPADVEVVLQEDEAVDFAWIAPRTALERGDFPMVFPTIKNLEAIAAFDSAGALLAARRNAVIKPVQPIIVVENGKKTIRLP